MFPLAHTYVAEKYFGELNKNIRLGSIAPDILAALPNFSFPETHETKFKNFNSESFEKAWNLHNKFDEFFHTPKYCYNLIPKTIKKDFGKNLGHLYIESAYDLLLYNDGIYYSFPKMTKKMKTNLEKYFGKNLVLEKTTEYFEHWTEKTYPKFLTRNMWFFATRQKHILTYDQINENIKLCTDNIQNKLGDYKLVFKEFLKKDKL
ncbi:hypothetical protein GF374_02795 [Candidatus Woesearchaeota archaeon]|nr:hypothetical protein [Candidatus Woesearchaeota archaeon]